MAKFDESRIEWDSGPAPAAAKFDVKSIEWDAPALADTEDQVSRAATRPTTEPVFEDQVSRTASRPAVTAPPLLDTEDQVSRSHAETNKFATRGSDIANHIMMGLTQTASGLIEAGKQYQKFTSLGMIQPEEDPISKFLDNAENQYRAQLTDKAMRSMEKKWATFEDPAWADPDAWIGGVFQSLPSTALTTGPTLGLAKLAFAGARAAGASVVDASLYAGKLAGVAGGIGEGVIQGGSSAKQVRTEINALPQEVLDSSEAYHALVESGLSPKAARNKLANDGSTVAMVLAGVTSAVFGGQGDRVLAKIMTEAVGEKVFRRIVRGMVGEGLFEEFPQGVTQQMSQNIAEMPANPATTLMQGTLEQGVQGAAIGAAMGGGMAAPMGRAATQQADPAAAAEAAKQAALAKAQDMFAGMKQLPPTLGPDQVAQPGMGPPAPTEPIPTLEGPPQLPAPGRTVGEASAAPVPVTEAPSDPEAHAKAVYAEREKVEQQRVALEQQAQQPARAPESGEPTASKITIDPNDPAASFAAIAAAPITPVSAEQPAPATVDPQAHQAAAGDLAAMFLHADQLTKQAKLTPPKERPAVVAESQRIAGEARAHIDAYRARYGNEAASHLHTTAAQVYHGLKGDYRTLVKPTPVQKSGVSTEREQPTGVNNAESVRSDEGQVREGGAQGQPSVQPGAVEGGRDLQQPAQEAPGGGQAAQGDRGVGAVAVPETGTTAPKLGTEVDRAAHEAAASPTNELTPPTAAQVEAGNYKMGHPVFSNGLAASIETPSTAFREDKQHVPPRWRRQMKGVHYGYWKNTEGADGVRSRMQLAKLPASQQKSKGRREGVDVMIKEGTPDDYNGPVFVVDQVNPRTGAFDEHKTMVGFATEQEARDAYQAQYEKGWKGLGGISQTSMSGLKTWMRFGDMSKPYADRVVAKGAATKQEVNLQGEAETEYSYGGAPVTDVKLGSLLGDDLKVMKGITHKVPTSTLAGQAVSAIGGRKMDFVERKALAGLLRDIEAMGIPAHRFTSLEGFFVFTKGQNMLGASVTTFVDGKAVTAIGINAKVLMSDNESVRKGAIFTILHEGPAGHELDRDPDHPETSITKTSPTFGVRIVGGEAVATGALMQEAIDNWKSGGPLSALLSYPLAKTAFWAGYYGTSEAERKLKAEVFAQLGPMWYTDRALLKREAPVAYKLFEEMHNATSQQGAASERVRADRIAVRETLRARGSVGTDEFGADGGIAAHEAGPGKRKASAGVEGRGVGGEAAGGVEPGVPAERTGEPARRLLKQPSASSKSAALGYREKNEKPLGDNASLEEIGHFFEKQVKDEFGSALDVTDPAAMARATAHALQEFKYQIKQARSGLDWYEEDVGTAHELTSRYIPELKAGSKASDVLGKASAEVHRQAFSIVAGIHSPHQNAAKNWENAALAYKEFTQTGRTPEMNPETGDRWGPYVQPLGFAQWNEMVADMGLNRTVEWLLTSHAVSELNAMKAKYGIYKNAPVAGKRTDVHLGAYIFGPKVGPFTLGLNGINTEVAVDVWATRTLHRYLGTMIEKDGKRAGKMIEAPTEVERAAFQKLALDIANETGYNPNQVQAVLWFFEQQLYTQMGLNSRSEKFSDGARNLLEGLGYDTGAATGTGAKGSGAARTAPQAGAPAAIVNIGLDTPDGLGIFPAEAANALRAQGVKVTSREVRRSGTEETLVATLDRPLTPAEAHAVAVELRQEAIVQKVGDKGELYGPNTAKWGPFSEEHFLEPGQQDVQAHEVTPEEMRGDGRGFTDFFTEASKGNRAPDKSIPYKPVLDISSLKEFSDEYVKHRGNFDDHIATSIPGFREVQQAVGDAIVKTYADRSAATLLDIGGSEGAFNKTITEMSDGRMFTLVLDPNVQMGKFFDEHSYVPGADYDVAALGTHEQEGKLAWTEDDGTKIKFFKPIEKYDVVHEAMVFQFISNTRDAQFARVKELMKPNGLAMFEEKVIDDTPQWKANEAQKDAYKAQYYTKAQMEAKKAEVLAKGAEGAAQAESEREQKVVGMNDLMVSTPTLERALKNHWRFVVQYWDSGNFKGYVASDDMRAIQNFIGNLVPLESEYTKVATPRVVTGTMHQEIMGLEVPDTPAFKKWFANSKVTDADGKALIVYHGSLSEIKKFSPAAVAEDSFAGPGFYFTSSAEDASHNYADIEGPDQSIKMETTIYLIQSDPEFYYDKQAENPEDPLSIEQLARAQLGFENDGVVYPVFLRITNPYYLERAPASKGSPKFLAMDASSHSNDFDVGIPSDYDTAEEFRAAVEDAGYDGIIDRGPSRFNMFGVDENTTHYVAFKPNQVKSVGNRGTFNISSQDIAAQEHDFGNLSPEQEAALRRTGGIVKDLTLREKYAQMRANIRTKLAQGVADQFRPLKDLDEHAYNLARLSKASDGALEAMLTYGNLSLVDGVTDARAGRPGVITTFQRILQGEHHRFMWWVAANRAEQLAREDREHLFGPEDIRALKTLNRGVMPDGTTRQAAYQNALAEYNRFSKNILDIAEQSGIIDGESRSTWEREFYIPFYRAIEAGASTANLGKRASGLVRQYAFKKLKGGEDKLNQDLMANMLMNWSHLLSASAKNRAATAALKAAADAGVAVRLTSPEQGATKHTVWALEDGKKVYYEVHDPYTLEAITSLEAGIVGGWAGKALSQFKNLLTMGVTANPAFKVRNLIRDSLASIAQSELSYNVPGNVATGIKHMVQKGQVHASLLAGGGLIRFGSMLEGNRASHVDKLIKKGVPRNRIVDTPEKMKDFVQAAWDHYNELGDISEGANRAALYAQERARGKTHEQASMAARDLLDFSMQGAWPAIRFITQTVPFMNARIQGLYKLGRAGAENPTRMAAVIGATALASIALMLAYGGDDDWKKREDWDRDNYWWFKIGDSSWRIPKPFEIGAIATLAERAVELWTDDEMTKRRFMQRLWFAVSQTFSMNPVPQIAKPLVDIYSNVDSFTGRPIETMGMENRSKPERYDSNTSLPAWLLGQAGDVTNLSPAQIDHLVKGYFGWLGTAATVAAEEAMRPFSSLPEKPERQLKDMFLAGNFVETLPADQSRYVTQFYDQAKVIQQAYADYRHMQQIGDFARAKEFRAAHQAEIAKEPVVTMAQRELQVLNQQKARIEADDSMTPSMKRTKLSLLAAKRNAVAARIARATSLD